MINVNKYNNQSAYATGNRPTDENCVSLVDNSVVYDGKNVVKTKRQLAPKEVCLVVKDTVDGLLKYIPVATFDPTTFDTERYQLKDWLRFGECMGKQLYTYKKDAGSAQWAAPNRYTLVCDTTNTGGFDWAITINGTAKSGTVAWDANDTLESIAAQINAVANIATVVEGESFIRVTVSSYSNSTLTLTADTGVTMTDLSIYCKIDGVAQEETHRTWQAQSVAALFPTLGFNAANTVQYGKNGLNMSYYAGGNYAKYLSYYRTSGSATWVAEASGRMNEVTFNKCADGTIGGADGIALYNKYGGSYEAYMMGGMVQIDDTHTGGMEYQSYDNGEQQNSLLCKVTTMDFEGNYVPAYPAAAMAKATVDADLDVDGHLPTTHEMALMMEAETYEALRKGMGFLTGSGLISNTGYYWLVAESYANVSWFYSGTYGILFSIYKYNTHSVRPVLAL